MMKDAGQLMILKRNFAFLTFAAILVSGCATTAPPPPPPPPPPAPMAPPPPPPPPSSPVMAKQYRLPAPQMMVLRGSANAIALYPKGRRVPVSGRICLPSYARFLTFQRQDGGLVTYGGGGCNETIREPSGARNADSRGVWSGP